MSNTKTAFTKRDIGLIIDASSDTADYLNSETIDFAKQYGFVCDYEADANDDDSSQFLSEYADDAVSFLNDLELPPYCSFYFEDNSLFLLPSVESAREYLEFVSSKNEEYPPADYEGEWLHVTDHGNVTLYVRAAGKDSELWSIV